MARQKAIEALSDREVIHLDAFVTQYGTRHWFTKAREAAESDKPVARTIREILERRKDVLQRVTGHDIQRAAQEIRQNRGVSV